MYSCDTVSKRLLPNNRRSTEMNIECGMNKED